MEGSRHNRQHNATVNGLTLLVMLALGVGIAVAWRAGIAQGRRATSVAGLPKPVAQTVAPAPPPPAAERAADTSGEQARTVASLLAENDALRLALRDAEAMRYQSNEFAEDRRRLLRDLAAARAETARYRDLCIDLENNAAPPLLDGPNAPDDLKLIVGIGPVLERMLHQLGVRPIARSRAGASATSTTSTRACPSFPVASAATHGSRRHASCTSRSSARRCRCAIGDAGQGASARARLRAHRDPHRHLGMQLARAEDRASAKSRRSRSAR